MEGLRKLSWRTTGLFSGSQSSCYGTFFWKVFIFTVTIILLQLVMAADTSQSPATNSGTNSTAEVLPDEVRLVNFLLATYKKMGKVARPTYNSSRLLRVEFALRLIQMDIIEKEQLLKTSVWVRARWVDEYLRWNPAHYGNITSIVLPWDDVWTPDIVLVNTAETDVSERHADVMVYFSGGVVWSPHRIFKSACMIDVTNFPYDRHTCHMWFQSMSRFSWQLDLQPYPKTPWDLETYLASFQQSQEWGIIQNTTERYSASRNVGVLLKFSRRVALRFTLTVQRRLGYTCHLLMLPCVFLGCLTLVVFCLPPERPDRHTLATSLFGSFMVLTLILVEVAPPTASSVPKLGMYYACNMTLVMISIFLSGMVINISRRGDRKQLVPRIVKIIFIDVAARALLLHSRVSKAFAWTVKSTEEEFGPPEENCEGLNNSMELTSQLMTKAAPTENSDLSMEINRRLANVERLVTHSANLGEKSDSRNLKILRIQWMSIALVMDRFFFCVYFITLIVTLIILFPRPEF